MSSTKKTKKVDIHEFYPDIYPRKIWIVKNTTPEFIVEHFKTRDGGELEGVKESFENSLCAVWDVTHGKDPKYGVLVWIISREFKGCDDISHEAVHVANKIFRDCGIDMHYDHDEHYAYFVGWIAGCIEQVVTGKFKD